MARLDTFKASIGGGIRPNQFSVTITPPTGLRGSLPELDENGSFKFLCHSSSLPGSSIGQAQVFHRGRMIPLSGERQFNPWTVQVYADQNMGIRRAFEKWSNYINNYADNTGETTKSNYASSAIVRLLDRNTVELDGASTYSYKMEGIFPIDIGEMPLGWAQNDVVGEFSVTFSIENFENDYFA